MPFCCSTLQFGFIDLLLQLGNSFVQRGFSLRKNLDVLRLNAVIQVDGAERRLQRGDDISEAGRVGRIDLDVEHVDAGKLLKQDCLSLHHWLAGQRADVAKAQDSGAI